MDPEIQKRARLLARHVKAFSEFMPDRLPAASEGKPPSRKVTCHYLCHMSRYQGTVKPPRTLSKNFPGTTYVEMPEADRCSGAAGSLKVRPYDQTMKVLDRKMENLEKPAPKSWHRMPGVPHPTGLWNQARRPES